jgi:hypothetical protein
MTLDQEDLEAIRNIFRDEIKRAFNVIDPEVRNQEPSICGITFRAIALRLGLDIFPTDYFGLIEEFKKSGNLPANRKESFQRFEDWNDTDTGRHAATISHRAFLDLEAERRKQRKLSSR